MTQNNIEFGLNELKLIYIKIHTYMCTLNKIKLKLN